MTILSTRRTALAITALAATAPLVLGATTSAAGSGSSKWVTLSTGNVGMTIMTPSIARFGGTYEVVWISRHGANFAIQARILNAAGAPTGSQLTPLKNWAGLALDPKILADGSTRVLAFGGDQTGSGNSGYDSDAEYYLTSSNGTSWELNSGSLSAADGARNGAAAVVNDGGTLITGLARQDGVVYHVGASTENPAPGTDPLTATTGNFSYTPGLGVDVKTHRVWALWYSNSGINGQDGVNAQVIHPTPGTRLHAPGSSDPVTKSQGVQVDLSAAARAGGGVYTAYRNPTGRRIVVWKVGASKPVTTVNGGPYGVTSVVVAAAPKGRIWLYWNDRADWRATRSNKAATRFSPVSVAKPPSAKDNIGVQLAGDGSAGPLEAIGTLSTATNVDEIVARQFLPRLSVSAPHSVHRGKRLVVKVTDAGDPVHAAKVRFGSVSKKTNTKGKATFTVARHANTGKATISVSINGYVPATTKVTVKA